MLDIQLGVGVGAIILSQTTELWQMQIVSRQKQFVSLPAAIYNTIAVIIIASRHVTSWKWQQFGI